MAASVQVLCPNGRRQNVKINPNTKLLQILEEVCQRQGFVPPENYILVQGRKELDLSLSVRFSSLPNNAKLELTKAASARVEQDVKIALQLDSGQRLQGTFKPSTTLWDLLLQLENEHSEHKDILSKVDRSTSPALHPVCIFMREEIIGMRALQEMNLKKLGLTSGNAIIRLLHRPVEESILQEIELKLEKEKEKQAKLEEIAQKKSELQQMIPEDNRSDETSSDLDQKVEQKSPSILDLESSAQKHGEPGDLHPEPMDTLENESSLSMSSSASEPSPAKQRPAHPKKNSKTFTHDSQSSSAGATAKTVQFSGVTEITDDEFLDLSPQEQAIARRLVAKYLPQSSSDTEEPPSFADFKFPEATKGMDLSGSDRKQMTEESLPSCDREAIIFRTDEPLSHESSQVDSIPEDFFEITQSDVKILYRDLQSAVQQLEDQPLMTKAMKRAQTEALYDQYERVVIRVQFPEKLTLQGVFRPRELVSALYSFVQEHLENKKISFYLYTTPPKFILKDKKSTLSSNHLAPAVIVYFGSDSHQDHYLSETTRQLLKTRLKAEAIVNTILQPSVPESETKKIEESRPASSRSQVASTSQGSLSSGAHIPKWLRLGKK